ncbi:hypothetical protein [Maricaulis sp.]|uniref:hypothetical protein n=1 Tax=Maricaulis sp. TaxID=1486257 RepID=UPI001B2B52F8|nr:hypothetical protein [Maricaulis sp.]MBO6796817.1 hypothetical protein [Maricaulis sp.]
MPKRIRHNRLLYGAALALVLSTPALAQAPADIRVERAGANVRLILDYPDSYQDSLPTADVDIEHTVLIAALSEPISADVADLVDELGSVAARARLDPDGRTLRIALNGQADTHTSASYDHIAIDIVPRGAAAPAGIISPREQAEIDAAVEAERLALEEANAEPEGPPPVPPLPVELRVGQATEYTRVELIWPEMVDYAIRQNDNVAEVRFSRPAEIDLARLAGSPPRFLRNASGRREGDEWVLRLVMEEGIRAGAWSEDGRVSIDMVDPDADNTQALLAQLAELIPENQQQEADDSGFEPAPESYAGETALAEDRFDSFAEDGLEDVTELPDAPLEPDRDPVPEDGVVHVAVTEFNGDLRTEFAWAGPVGASVFRRGRAIWIVFDAAADLDLNELGHRDRRHVQGYQIVRGEDFVAARLEVPETTQAEARLEGDEWAVVFSERIDSPPRPVNVRRDARRGRLGRILVGLTAPSAVRWVDDPVVGDRLGVITADGPVQGLASRRAFVGGALLPSAQGAAVEALAEDLLISINGAGAIIGRPEGLDLTPSSDGSRSQGGSSVLANIASPALMDFDNWRGEGYFADEWADRLRRAAMENGPDGHITLARFLLANNLAPETLGMLNLAVSNEPELGADHHIRAMRGVASYMLHRLDDAEAYLSNAGLVADPATDMWRGLIAVEQERWEDARRRLGAGADAAYFYPPVWQARYEAALARATLELGDFAAAEQHLYAIEAGEPDEQTQLDAAYVAARLDEARGNLDSAIEQLEVLAQSGNPPMEARAIYELTRARLAAEQITREQAIDELENLRFRWRGDSIESDTIRTLGELYVSAGEFGLGLEVMARGQTRFEDNEAGRRIFDDMNSTFRRLFLDGEADRMDPVEAVALFYQYQHLAPIGTDGDRMIRRLADRLIAFDLLDPASELLQHQVDNRLREPLARARVATDLAVVYLMDHRYEDAMRTIQGSRVAGLPRQLVNERYLLEARALSELGRADTALELIAGDTSPEAIRLRADIAWENRDWPATGRRLERILADRYQDAAPLTPSEQNDLMRAAIAYSLSEDRDSSARLGERYGAAMDLTDQAAAFELLTDNSLPAGNVRFNDLAGQIAGIDTLDAFMEPFRRRFDGGGA